eukprot:2907982-Prymnesium_polylepis.2
MQWRPVSILVLVIVTSEVTQAAVLSPARLSANGLPAWAAAQVLTPPQAAYRLLFDRTREHKGRLGRKSALSRYRRAHRTRRVPVSSGTVRSFRAACHEHILSHLARLQHKPARSLEKSEMELDWQIRLQHHTRRHMSSLTQ